ncbi:hypothetical protein EJ06DRAFT_557785 [Trichodelitschia bisporula]|uniref:Uncharacterized protein n=1 Tax=Trichodelitschia bisporula TaxID=703511 RepID=A0A6G1HUB9_9PEZI|nr:hypothetical protein EJ06DRAFT_557785 [Trichodelitschia bisporula]
MSVAAKASKSILPPFLVFMATAGTYTFISARGEGSKIDDARTRFEESRHRQELRITHGEEPIHEGTRYPAAA